MSFYPLSTPLLTLSETLGAFHPLVVVPGSFSLVVQELKHVDPQAWTFVGVTVAFVMGFSWLVYEVAHTPSVTERKCTICSGTGVEQRHHYIGLGFTEIRQTQCHWCLGTGVFEISKPKAKPNVRIPLVGQWDAMVDEDLARQGDALL